MLSVFDFERICVNCRWFGYEYILDWKCCHPDLGIVDTEKEDTCDKWETKYVYEPTYLMSKDGKVIETALGGRDDVKGI